MIESNILPTVPSNPLTKQFEMATEWTKEWLTAHNFDPAQAEMTGLVIVITTFVLVYLITRSPSKSDTVTTVLCKDRRSVEKFSGPASLDEIKLALKCAIHAPNHFKTEPWRFRLLGAEGKATLGELNDKFKSDGQFAAGTKVPDFLVVSIKAIKTDDFSEWTVNALEDHAAAAAAVQNFMVSCASQGVATKWMTGKMGISGSDILTKCCGVDDVSTEHYMGTLLVGKPQVAMSSMKVPERKQGLDAPVFEVTA